MWHIDIQEEFGSVTGYVVDSNKEQVGNYLAGYTSDNERIATWLRDNVARVALLKNLNVEDEARGNGFGNDLLDAFTGEAESEGAEAVLLIADSAEGQREGFNLVEWYERHDFAQILSTGAGPLLLYPGSRGEQLKACLAVKA